MKGAAAVVCLLAWSSAEVADDVCRSGLWLEFNATQTSPKVNVALVEKEARRAFQAAVAAHCAQPSEDLDEAEAVGWCFEVVGVLKLQNGTAPRDTVEEATLELRTCRDLLMYRPVWSFLPDLYQINEQCNNKTPGHMHRFNATRSQSTRVYARLKLPAIDTALYAESTLSVFCLSVGNNLPPPKGLYMKGAVVTAVILAVFTAALVAIAFYSEWKRKDHVIPVAGELEVLTGLLHKRALRAQPLLAWCEKENCVGVKKAWEDARKEVAKNDGVDDYNFFAWTGPGRDKFGRVDTRPSGIRGWLARVCNSAVALLGGSEEEFPVRLQPPPLHEPFPVNLSRFIRPSKLAAIGLPHQAFIRLSDINIADYETFHGINSRVFESKFSRSLLARSRSRQSTHTHTSTNYANSNTRTSNTAVAASRSRHHSVPKPIPKA